MRLLPPAFRRLLGYQRRYIFPEVTLAVCALLVLSATNGAIPFLARNFINQIAGLKDLGAVRALSLEILAIFLLRAFTNFGSDYLTANIGQKVVMDLRSELNYRIQLLPLSFFNRTTTGALLSRVINDVALVSVATTDSVFSIVGDGCSLVAVLTAALYIDWRLTIIAAVGFPTAVLPVLQFSKRMRRMTRRAQRQLGGLAALLQESIQGNRVVKAFGMEDYERRRFDIELRRLFRVYMKVSRIKALTAPLIEVMAAFAVVAVLWYGTASVISGVRSPGSFAAFFTAMLLVYEPFKRLSRTNNTIQQGIAAAERVFEIMDEPADVVELPDAIELPRSSHSIEFRGVSFKYADDWVLRDVNLRIGAGEVVALVGMSGGGKSTLADLIPRFYDAGQGAVTVDGIDIRRFTLRSLRAGIGLVTQHTFLFNDTIGANIAYGSIDKNSDDIIRAAKLANAHDFIMRLPHGYESSVGELGVLLSGGERQRVAIARALLKDAPILILDEATSSLDSEAERLVQEALEHLIENRTTLVIAHRLSTVRRADRIAVIAHGRIVEEGTHEQLLALGREYRRLYDLQFHLPDEIPPAELGKLAD